MLQINDWTLSGSDNQPIFGNTHMPACDPVGVLVLSHGFKGYKDYGFFPQLAEQAAEAGLIAHRFNFSHSGMTNQTDTFERPDLFEKDTWSKQIDDLTLVINAATTGDLKGKENLPVVLFGHSRGGYTTLLTAAHLQKSPAKKVGLAIQGVVTAASPDEACSLDQNAIRQLKTDGRLLSPSGRTGQDLYVGLDWYAEIEHNPKAFDALQAVKKITCPLCLIHGNEDPTVPASAAQNLADAAGENAVRIIIPKTDHVFSAPNPLPLDQTAPPHTQVFMDHVVRFAASKCVTQ